MKEHTRRSKSELWAEFRFSVIGHLLASPPSRGELINLLRELAATTWRHPVSGKDVRYGISTIERWYYCCRKEMKSPVEVLRRKVRADRGRFKVLSGEHKRLLAEQYAKHPSWSYQLHADNLSAILRSRGEPELSYSTVYRYLQISGLFKQRKKRGGVVLSGSKEVRSFEAEYVGGLWHLDFHHCSRQILTQDGKWKTPICVAVIDDHSRLLCHMQWYYEETTKVLVHGFSQALQKRGLPRALLTDNGSAMTSMEFTQGLSRLGIIHKTTLPYSPYQNGKQEKFFAIVEGRLMAMLENYEQLDLSTLNRATMAWVEKGYNQQHHDDIKQTPLSRHLSGKSVLRDCPGSAQLRDAFCRQVTRKQRMTDGTVSLEGKRFELPSSYRHFREVCVRYASWDLSHVTLVDKETGRTLSTIYPLDLVSNAEGKRRLRQQIRAEEVKPCANGERDKEEIAPLLKEMLAEQEASGLPPAYIPLQSEEEEEL